MTTKTQTVCRGRPCAFNKEEALGKALELFWRNGYEGTSLSDLTKVMGINKPSLYSAFGNKEQLFLQAIDLYEKRPGAFFYSAMDQKTAYLVVQSMLRGAADSMANGEHPQGCVVVQGALSCSEASATVKEALIKRRLEEQQELQKRFEQAQQDGDLPQHIDAANLASYIGTVLQGMCVQANNGASTAELYAVADMVLENFPKA
ncbi:TetR/AcrR family transcriptional regulator [Idiomarina baltica]|uniref:Transcriptional regulator, TetR family protein n=1 Tax=Idiomarina baltica OS145 TaxID=314276 RepID=A0ABP2CU08_9GAMM|nr:TetR/AcrR family transcriptional regulator [Idiomarina baltica]EAQ33296.1 transcriptional regulator, TetR family protein [Idiomarina baltica OS145]